MTLASMKADLASLKQTVADFISGKVAAAATALTEFQNKLSALESGSVAELTRVSADLATTQATVGTITTALMAACTAEKVELKADMTPADMLSSLVSAQSAKVAAADAAKTDLAGQLTTANNTSAAKQGVIDAANAKLAGFLKAVKLQVAEGATLEQNADACTKAITGALAAQGITVEQTAEAAPTAAGEPVAKADVLTQYADLQKTSPREATAFYEKNKAAIDKAWYASLK